MWGLVFGFVSPLLGVWACFYLVGFPVGKWWFFGLMPLSYVYRGGAVRFLFSLVTLASCILRGCLWGFTLLVINS